MKAVKLWHVIWLSGQKSGGTSPTISPKHYILLQKNQMRIIDVAPMTRSQHTKGLDTNEFWVSAATSPFSKVRSVDVRGSRNVVKFTQNRED